jgi:DNA-binding protein H-NS
MQQQKNRSIKVEKIDFESLDIKTLIAIKQNLDSLIKRKQNQFKQDFKQKLQVKASDLGIDLAKFFDSSFPSKKKSASQPKKKYEYKGVQWSGRGRCPNIYKQFFENGGKKTDLLIENRP